jgi:hypothetical protein
MAAGDTQSAGNWLLISAYEIRLQYVYSRAQSSRDVIEGSIRLLKIGVFIHAT